jgi:misacylated tRNA(Ala) deacylase
VAATVELFHKDAYLKRCRAHVLQHAAGELQTDATLFYPLGGGQPGDTGWVTLPDGSRHAVTDTRRDKESRAIVHFIDASLAPIAPGTEVELELDWQRRHRHMRMHTCLHLLSAVVRAGVTGGNLNDHSGRLDFDATELALDPLQITDDLQRLISADLAVTVRLTTGADLAAQPELIRTMSVTPPLHLPMIRLIDIASADLQPCGGTHVARTGEIGAVRVLRIENKGARNKRVVLTFIDDAA